MSTDNLARKFSPDIDALITFLSSSIIKDRNLYSATEIEILKETLSSLYELKSYDKTNFKSQKTLATEIIFNLLKIFGGEDPFDVLSDFFDDYVK